jgi:tRNA (adenine37-N6)-methyltransferase
VALIDKLKALIPGPKGLIPREPVEYKPIGVVRNRVRRPQPFGWESVRSDIILREDLEEALDAIEGFSHVIVVCHLHQIPEEVRRLRIPVGDGPERGVLATRSQLRPNSIAVSVAQVLHRRKTALRVLGLDAIDGTPVLDIKPYLPTFDAVATATIPDWAVLPRSE